MEILPSGKTGSDIFDNRAINPNKVLDRLSMRIIAQSLRKFYEVVRGWSYSGDESSATAIDEDLSIITAANISDYESTFTQGLNTLIAFNNTLEVDGTSTENDIVLVPKKISTEVSPNSTDYSTVCPLPLKYQDDLEFTFRATDENTGAVTISIPSLSGLVGTMDLVDESGNDLGEGEITSGKYIRIKLKTISAVKKAILIKGLVRKATSTSSGITLIHKQVTITNGSDADHDLNFTAGNFTFDDGSGQAILSATTKRFDATFALGTNAGGMVNGQSLPTNGAVYLYQVSKPDGSLSDIIGTTTYGGASIATEPVIVSNGLSKKRYLGAFYTDGSDNIRAGKWTYDSKGAGYKFLYTTEITDVTATLTGSAQTATLTVPAFSEAIVSHKHTSQSVISTEQSCSYINLVDSITNLVSSVRSINSTSNMNRQRLTIKVNASKQFQYQGGSANAGDVLIITQGWQEYL
jgi:hypothetical protein